MEWNPQTYNWLLRPLSPLIMTCELISRRAGSRCQRMTSKLLASFWLHREFPALREGGMGSLADGSSMTTSQFMEQVKYNNAIEIELARTISEISTIETARVHLAAPKQSVFVRDRQPARHLSLLSLIGACGRSRSGTVHSPPCPAPACLISPLRM